MKYFLLILVLLSCFCRSQAQDSNLISLSQAQEMRLKKMENFQSDIRTDFENQKDRIKLDFDTLKSENSHQYWRLTLEILVFVMVLFGGFIGLKKWAIQYAKDQIEEKMKKEVPEMVRAETIRQFQSSFDQKKDEILALIEKNERVARYKQQKNILVLCEDEVKKKNDEDLFHKVYEIPFAEIKTWQEWKESKYQGNWDLVIIERLDKSYHYQNMTPAAMESLVKDRCKDHYFLYFGPYHREFDYKNEALNYSNSKYTLIPRMVEMLEFVHLTRKKS